MIISDSPSQKALERMMTQVKGFPPRGSGVMVLRRFEYTAEMCDCRLCLYYNRKKKCTVSQCPCIEERIVAGAAGRSEVMTETMKDIHNAAFRKRLIQFIRESEELHMNFRNEKHRLAFDEAIRKLNKLDISVRYQNMLVNHILPKLGNRRISSIGTDDIKSFVQDQLQNGRLDGKGGLSSVMSKYTGSLLSTYP